MVQLCPNPNDTLRATAGLPETKSDQYRQLDPLDSQSLPQQLHEQYNPDGPKEQTRMTQQCSNDKAEFAQRAGQRRQRAGDKIP